MNWIEGEEGGPLARGAGGLSWAGERKMWRYKIMANPPELNENDDNIYK